MRKELYKYVKLNPESIGTPKLHLGSGVRRVTLENGVNTWAVRSSQIIWKNMKNVER